MTLYSANVLDLATPVNGPSSRKRKQPSSTKKTDLSPKDEIETPEVLAPPAGDQPPKKVLSEKQLAALARAKEAREKKKQDAAKALLLEQERLQEEARVAEETQKAAEEKKLALKEKRRLAREAKKALQTPPDTSADGDSVADIIEQVTAEPKKKKIRLEDDNTPPTWFKQYVAGVKKEEAKVGKDKKPQKQIAQEAQEVATNQWNDGFTRDRVRTEVDNHMSRMYHMMFGGRRLK